MACGCAGRAGTCFDYIKGLLAAPEDREPAVRKLKQQAVK